MGERHEKPTAGGEPLSPELCGIEDWSDEILRVNGTLTITNDGPVQSAAWQNDGTNRGVELAKSWDSEGHDAYQMEIYAPLDRRAEIVLRYTPTTNAVEERDLSGQAILNGLDQDILRDIFLTNLYAADIFPDPKERRTAIDDTFWDLACVYAGTHAAVVNRIDDLRMGFEPYIGEAWRLARKAIRDLNQGISERQIMHAVQLGLQLRTADAEIHRTHGDRAG